MEEFIANKFNLFAFNRMLEFLKVEKLYSQRSRIIDAKYAFGKSQSKLLRNNRNNNIAISYGVRNWSFVTIDVNNADCWDNQIIVGKLEVGFIAVIINF